MDLDILGSKQLCKTQNCDTFPDITLWPTTWGGTVPNLPQTFKEHKNRQLSEM
jgi:hypothetical protein